ncbi:hypothetical protein F4781DRAFT_259651 [Annulohypoxylon bovei var. microspora]|nr:hypothetical protein F4781DRAFT_259651 [Annulohypoxylon bovei var. microspora]
MSSKHAWKIEWVDAAKKGEKTLYWAVFSDTVPDREALIKKHIEAYPKESTPLRETAAEIRLVPRQPTMAEFTPIGHVAVAIHEPEEDVKLGLPPTGAVWIHGLYISRALHGGGFGAGTMSKIETLATQSPMNAKIMALDTLSKAMQTDPEKRELMYGEGGIPAPSVTNEDWYVRLGYEVFKREDNVFVSLVKGGVSLPINLVYMRKLVA